MSRITNKEHIIDLSSVDLVKKQFIEENEYYSKHNVYDTINSKKSLAKYINVQIILGYKCNKDCYFCIENGNYKKFKESSEDTFINELDELLNKLVECGNIIDVTITGGEPTLYKNKLLSTIKLVNSCKHIVRNFSINSNGFNINLLNDISENFDYINISSHCKITETLNKKLAVLTDAYIENIKFLDKLCIQKVLMQNDTMSTIMDFIDSYLNKMLVKNFSLRIPYETDDLQFGLNIINEISAKIATIHIILYIIL